MDNYVRDLHIQHNLFPVKPHNYPASTYLLLKNKTALVREGMLRLIPAVEFTLLPSLAKTVLQYDSSILTISGLKFNASLRCG